MTKRLVLVTRDGAVRAQILPLLADAAYDVWDATDGEVALCGLLHAPDARVVLLDSQLPGPYGAALLLEPADQGALFRHEFVLIHRRDAGPLPADIQLLRATLSVPVVNLASDRGPLLDVVDHATQRLLPLSLLTVHLTSLPA